MKTSEIRQTLWNNEITKKSFGGVFPVDGLYSVTLRANLPVFYVVNCDTSEMTGSHWCVLFINSYYCELFDPSVIQYGYVEKASNIIEDFVVRNNLYLTYVNQQEYHSNPTYDTTCGLHCLYFCYQRCLSISSKNILNSYPHDIDNIVKKLFKTPKK